MVAQLCGTMLQCFLESSTEGKTAFNPEVLQRETIPTQKLTFALILYQIVYQIPSCLFRTDKRETNSEPEGARK